MLAACLIAAFAIAAVAASGASALPEWGKCVAQAGGKYTDSGCTTKGKGGSFEWKKGATLKNVKFSGHNVGAGGVLSTTLQLCHGPENINETRITDKKCEEEGGTVEPTGTIQVECESESNHGEQVGKDKIANVSVKFLGCEALTFPCSNGPNEGEINVNTLKGSLGYISKSEKTVGVLLEPVVKHGEFAKFNCGGFLGTVVGVGNKKEGTAYAPENKGGNDGIISPITPVNVMSNEFTQVYTINEETDENIPSKFDGKHISLLEDYTFNVSEPHFSSKWSKAGQTITNVNTPEEEGEIKA